MGYTRGMNENEMSHLLGQLPPRLVARELRIATAREIGLFDLALELASRSPCDPKTLTRAARDYLETEPAFALGCAVAAYVG